MENDRAERGVSLLRFLKYPLRSPSEIKAPITEEDQFILQWLRIVEPYIGGPSAHLYRDDRPEFDDASGNPWIDAKSTVAMNRIFSDLSV